MGYNYGGGSIYIDNVFFIQIIQLVLHFDNSLKFYPNPVIIRLIFSLKVLLIKWLLKIF